ncbi:hypothetical protein Dda_3696 [Drechslerella dactyloides]|uniref:Uncharacterized protein n=1 Tax=Drechslerella dactyloides TaxID=74499 RepID=A0AAD6J2R4_DREDA|nr:hypothetical protein Dda_3696 [Drechslerella dactyloides]
MTDSLTVLGVIWGLAFFCNAYDRFRIGVQPSDPGAFPWKTEEPLWLHADIPIDGDSLLQYGSSTLEIRPWENENGVSVKNGIWMLLEPEQQPWMMSQAKYLELALSGSDTAVTKTLFQDDANDIPIELYQMTGIDDPSIMAFVAVQANCRYMSFNVHYDKPDTRFEIVFQLKTPKGYDNSVAEEFYACWPYAANPGLGEIQMSKAIVDLSIYPRLFASADVPDQECHEVWLYLTYYGANYNFPAGTSEKEDDDSEPYTCSPMSEFALIKEPLGASQNSQWSFESGTEQILTPKVPKKPLSDMEVVDEWATTPRIDDFASTGLLESGQFGYGNLKSPSIMEEEAEAEAENETNEGNVSGLGKSNPAGPNN